MATILNTEINGIRLYGVKTIPWLLASMPLKLVEEKVLLLALLYAQGKHLLLSEMIGVVERNLFGCRIGVSDYAQELIL